MEPSAVIVHCSTMLLIYAYVKQQLTFPFIFVLSPSLLLFALLFWHQYKNLQGLKRAKYVVACLLFILFTLTISKAIKNEGGMTGGFDDDKWLVRHRRSFELLPLSGMLYSLLSFVDPSQSDEKSLVK